MAKILITCGPIPTRLDSVKYITNRFKGGLAYKTASELCEGYGHEVIMVKWKYSDLPNWIDDKNIRMNIINVEDIYDYRDILLKTSADVYILAAAVANLMPSNPWEGKFPSHQYKVGDKFNIEFEIAPRIIDLIKKKHPRSGLVGYKLFDGSDEELIKAGWETLINSKANIVFANHPSWAKEKKIMLTLDGAEISMTFDEHVKWIDKLARAKYYMNQLGRELEVLNDFVNLKEEIQKNKELKSIIDSYPKYEKHNMIFGCFAYKINENCFITTSRGKKNGEITEVLNVDHSKRIIKTLPHKATLNAPFLDAVFKKNTHIKILIHGHQPFFVPKNNIFSYELPGTDQEVKLAELIKFSHDNVFYYINHHGFIGGFQTVEEWRSFQIENYYYAK